MRAAAQHPTPDSGVLGQEERFEFGENWRLFLDLVDEERIAAAEQSLRDRLKVESLAGRSFLDIGSGSGLFSLAALRLGAERVHSLDLDNESVACALAMRQRHAPGDLAWTVEEGSILDEGHVARLGRWDVVYSWGVLHHTGAMWRALELAASTVADGGLLFVSIYNDQGYKSRLWRRIKRTYNRLPKRLRPLYAVLVMGPLEIVRSLALAVGRAPLPERGMSRRRDIVDWIGGYPFEVAKPDEVVDFLHARGFRLERLVTRGGGSGCNEYVFSRAPAAASTTPA